MRDSEYQILQRKRRVAERGQVPGQDVPVDGEWSEWEVVSGYNKIGPPVYRTAAHARIAITQLSKSRRCWRYFEFEYKLRRRFVLRGRWFDSPSTPVKA